MTIVRQAVTLRQKRVTIVTVELRVREGVTLVPE